MGRRVLKPNYDNLAELIDETFPTEIKIKFIQKLLRADLPEVSAQKLLWVYFPKEVVLKLVK